MITCNSLEGKFRCSTKVKEFEIVSDATIEKGGQGQGFRPHDILESAYASCLNIFVQMLCEKMRISSDNISVMVDLTRLESKTIFNYSIKFGDNFSEGQKEKILKAVEGCPVRKTLSKSIEFELKNDL
jgi:putative redox protein